MLSLIGSRSSSTSDIASDPQFPQFERFIRQHRGGTPYGSEQETIARFTIFKDTLATIDARNAAGKEKHGVTKFADLTPAEFKAKHTGLAPTTAKLPKKFHAVPGNATNTASVNWRTWARARRSRTRGQCGSCWAFSATEQLESDYFLTYGTLKTRSRRSRSSRATPPPTAAAAATRSTRGSTSTHLAGRSRRRTTDFLGHDRADGDVQEPGGGGDGDRRLGDRVHDLRLAVDGARRAILSQFVRNSGAILRAQLCAMC